MFYPTGANCYKKCYPSFPCIGPQGPTGATGATGPTGATGAAPDTSFASYFNYLALFSDGEQIPLITNTADPTGQITLINNTQVSLPPGYYLISYHATVFLRSAGFMQVTPSYNGAPRVEVGIYFRTTQPSTAGGSNTIIIAVPSNTIFTLTYNSNVASEEGAATLSIVKLREFT